MLALKAAQDFRRAFAVVSARFVFECDSDFIRDPMRSLQSGMQCCGEAIATRLLAALLATPAPLYGAFPPTSQETNDEEVRQPAAA